MSFLRAVCIIEVETLLATTGAPHKDVAHAIGSTVSINILYRVPSPRTSRGRPHQGGAPGHLEI